MCTFSYAQIITLEWIVDGQQYGNTTTCEYSGDVILPTPPTKYGYTFAGWEPSDYIFLEYIEGTGQQWIDTEIVPTSTMNLYIKWTWMSTEVGWVLSGRNSFNDGVSIAGKMWMDWFGRPEDVDRYSFNTQSNIGDMLIVSIENSILKIYKNDILLNVHSFVPTSSTIYTMFLNASNSSTKKYNAVNCINRIYHFKIDGIADMRPAIRISDNAVGMYDVIRQRFFENAGTGAFTPGPIINE